MKVTKNAMFTQMSAKASIKIIGKISGRYGRRVQTNIQSEHGK